MPEKATTNARQRAYLAALKTTPEGRAKLDKWKANKRKWIKRNLAKINAQQNAKRANQAYRAERNAKQNAYRAGLIRSYRGPAIGELRNASLQQNEIYAAADRAAPKGLPRWMREDVISDMVEAVLAGRERLDELAVSAAIYVRRYNKAHETFHLSLDAEIPGSDKTYLTLVTADDLPWR